MKDYKVMLAMLIGVKPSKLDAFMPELRSLLDECDRLRKQRSILKQKLEIKQAELGLRISEIQLEEVGR